jgi:L-seryl-tRNA(Ser) seleniumtransferase
MWRERDAASLRHNQLVKSVFRPELYRRLPSVDELLHTRELAECVSRESHASVADAARSVLARLRAEIAAGALDEKHFDLVVSGLAGAIEAQLQQNVSFSLRAVINATGVILHTNLGRAPLGQPALEHVQATSTSYSNLEYDLGTGERGKRDVHVDRLFKKLLSSTESSPQVSTIVVNNNAAAVLLALNSLADCGEVIVSRGELVEIGGSFRIPDVMAKSNAILREVGTTNRTRVSDYERAINENTKLLLRVHRSNFEITGFTEQPALAELVALSRKCKIPLMEDLGSGALFNLQTVGVRGEPGVLDSLQAGVDVVSYSGDKLLGGPQAGLLSGRADLISRMRSNSLFRALRVDKMIYAALEATLLAYVKRDHDEIPVLRMMGLSKQEIGSRAEAIASAIPVGSLQGEVIDGESVIGGGSAPSAVLPTRLLALTSKRLSADELAGRLRAANLPIIARVEQGRVLLDLRTVFPGQDEMIVTALADLPE